MCLWRALSLCLCVRCPHNHTTPRNTDRAILYQGSFLCLPLFERFSDNTCKPCLRGFYSPEVGSMCIASPKGTIVQYPGSSLFQKCHEKFFSFLASATTCTPCSPGTYSNPANTLSIPGNKDELKTFHEYMYNLAIFCVAAISRGLGAGNIQMTKYSNIYWNTYTSSIRIYFPAFVNTDVTFESSSCTHIAILHRIVVRFVYSSSSRGMIGRDAMASSIAMKVPSGMENWVRYVLTWTGLMVPYIRSQPQHRVVSTCFQCESNHTHGNV